MVGEFDSMIINGDEEDKAEDRKSVVLEADEGCFVKTRKNRP